MLGLVVVADDLTGAAEIGACFVSTLFWRQRICLADSFVADMERRRSQIADKRRERGSLFGDDMIVIDNTSPYWSSRSGGRWIDAGGVATCGTGMTAYPDSSMKR